MIHKTLGQENILKFVRSRPSAVKKLNFHFFGMLEIAENSCF